MTTLCDGICLDIEVEDPSIEMSTSDDTIIIEAVAGITGAPGPVVTQFLVTAGMVLSGHRVVRPQFDGTVVYADNTDLTDAHRPLWLTLGAALLGGQVLVQSYGPVEEPSWSWTDGAIFLGTNGQLTQTVPTSPAAFLIQVAAPDEPTKLFYDPRDPIALV
jgi:hypothetical protein